MLATVGCGPLWSPLAVRSTSVSCFYAAPFHLFVYVRRPAVPRCAWPTLPRGDDLGWVLGPNKTLIKYARPPRRAARAMP